MRRASAIYRTDGNRGLQQEEWQYDDTYVGLIAGTVAYVLK